MICSGHLYGFREPAQGAEGLHHIAERLGILKHPPAHMKETESFTPAASTSGHAPQIQRASKRHGSLEEASAFTAEAMATQPLSRSGTPFRRVHSFPCASSLRSSACRWRGWRVKGTLLAAQFDDCRGRCGRGGVQVKRGLYSALSSQDSVSAAWSMQHSASSTTLPHRSERTADQRTHQEPVALVATCPVVLSYVRMG